MLSSRVLVVALVVASAIAVLAVPPWGAIVPAFGWLYLGWRQADRSSAAFISASDPKIGRHGLLQSDLSDQRQAS